MPVVIADQQITAPLVANVPATGLENASIGTITGIATRDARDSALRT